MRAAYFIVLMKVCYGSMPRYNRDGSFNSTHGRTSIERVRQFYDIDLLWELHDMLTNKRMHEEKGLQLTLTFGCADVRETVKRVVPKSSATNFVVYMDPPYDDTADVYGKNETVTCYTNWSVMYLIESCKKQKRKTPTILISNCVGFHNRYCKYVLRLRIMSKHTIQHRVREELLVSNKSICKEKIIKVE